MTLHQPSSQQERRGVVLLAALVVIVLLSLAAYQYSDLMINEYKAATNAHRAAQARQRHQPHAGIAPFGADEVSLYDGEIRYTDLHIGRLLDALRAKGVYDKTIIAVTGDHGEGFGEHAIKLHG